MPIKMGKIKKTVKTSNIVKNAEKLHHLHIGKATLGDKLAVFYKVKHVFIICPNNYTLEQLF